MGVEHRRVRTHIHIYTLAACTPYLEVLHVALLPGAHVMQPKKKTAASEAIHVTGGQPPQHARDHDNLDHKFQVAVIYLTSTFFAPPLHKYKPKSRTYPQEILNSSRYSRGDPHASTIINASHNTVNTFFPPDHSRNIIHLQLFFTSLCRYLLHCSLASHTPGVVMDRLIVTRTAKLMPMLPYSSSSHHTSEHALSLSVGQHRCR